MICDLPEHEIVRVCAGVLPGEEKSARLAALCGPDVDWGKVFAAAKAHGVVFLLYKVLKAHGSGVPGDFLERLRQLYLRNSADNLRVSARLVRILGVLADAVRYAARRRLSPEFSFMRPEGGCPPNSA